MASSFVQSFCINCLQSSESGPSSWFEYFPKVPTNTICNLESFFLGAWFHIEWGVEKLSAINCSWLFPNPSQSKSCKILKIRNTCTYLLFKSTCLIHSSSCLLTLEFLISIGLRLLILGVFSRVYALIWDSYTTI